LREVRAGNSERGVVVVTAWRTDFMPGPQRAPGAFQTKGSLACFAFWRLCVGSAPTGLTCGPASGYRSRVVTARRADFTVRPPRSPSGFQAKKSLACFAWNRICGPDSQATRVRPGSKGVGHSPVLGTRKRKRASAVQSGSSWDSVLSWQIVGGAVRLLRLCLILAKLGPNFRGG
jgi:hypothetical protein